MLEVVRVDEIPRMHFMRPLEAGDGPSTCELGVGWLDSPAEQDDFVAVAMAHEPGPTHPCRYHRVDWTAICAFAVSAVENGYVAAAGRTVPPIPSSLGPGEAAFARSILSPEEPIQFSRSTIIQGQHRVCAMRCAAVEVTVAIRVR